MMDDAARERLLAAFAIVEHIHRSDEASVNSLLALDEDPQRLMSVALLTAVGVANEAAAMADRDLLDIVAFHRSRLLEEPTGE